MTTGPLTDGGATAALRAVARRFMTSLDPTGLAAAGGPFDAADRRDWTYLPVARPGVALGDLGPASRALVDDLLAVTMSAAGAARAQQVMELDDILDELQQTGDRGGALERESHGSDRYWLRILGHPDDEAWAWHLGGQHLALHATVVGDMLSTTPCFIGALPAVVRHGPRAGLQVLREEEILARELIASLDPDQRRAAIVSQTAPDDIATRSDPVADPGLVPTGVHHDDLEPAQRSRLDAVLRCYFERAQEDVASRAWTAVVDAGLGSVSFAWAGSTTPGRPNYYAVKGATFLLEYDNTQDDANHVHTIWRDLQRDWGDDLLAQHHATLHPGR